MSEPIPTQEQLEAWCAEWQERLRLQDWCVLIRLSEKYELDGNQARVNANLPLRYALILVNPFSDDDEGDFPLHSYELRVIHELVHLHLEAVWPKCGRDDLPWIIAEQAVESLACGLHRAKYHDAAADRS